MLLYLIQHGDAKKEEEDPSRPLSNRGVEDVERAAAYLKRLGIAVKDILHSGKLRAKQTAEIIARNLPPGCFKSLSETDGLFPLDNPGIWDDRLKYMSDDMMLVGHLPHLGRLCSLLLCGDEEKHILSFKMGCVVCMERDANGVWSVRWAVTPDILVY
jgi:phosphohistidine phosphatase